MLVSVLPADKIVAAQPESFPAGSLVFASYMEHTQERLQLGVRVSDDRDVLALTPWFGGHRKAGTIIQPRNDRPVFGLMSDRTGKPVLDFDPSALTQESPDAWRGALGFLGFGDGGLVLYAQTDEPSSFPSTRGVLIDPVSWAAVDEEPGRFPASWTTAWSLRFPLGEGNWFAIAPDRLAASA